MDAALRKLKCNPSLLDNKRFWVQGVELKD